MKAVSAAACLIIAVIVHVSYVIKDLPLGLVLWGLVERELEEGRQASCGQGRKLFVITTISHDGDQVQINFQGKDVFREFGMLLYFRLNLKPIRNQESRIELSPAHPEEWEPWGNIDFSPQ